MPYEKIVFHIFNLLLCVESSSCRLYRYYWIALRRGKSSFDKEEDFFKLFNRVFTVSLVISKHHGLYHAGATSFSLASRILCTLKQRACRLIARQKMAWRTERISAVQYNVNFVACSTGEASKILGQQDTKTALRQGRCYPGCVSGFPAKWKVQRRFLCSSVVRFGFMLAVKGEKAKLEKNTSFFA